MASSIFKPSRLIGAAVVVGTVVWVASGQFGPHADEGPAAEVVAPAEPAKVPALKVAVADVAPEEHRRQVVLSCTTAADHSAVAVARGAGVIIELKVESGSAVKANDVIAVLSDEGRNSSVKQAEALLLQRKAEFEANKRLIDKGNAPRNNLPALEAGVAAAEAAVSSAKAEAEKSMIRAPIGGVVNAVPVQVGQAVQPGAEIAEVIDPDPMLAVGAVTERQRGMLKNDQPVTTRFIDGRKVEGTISFVGMSSDRATRTYRVEARMANADAAIADGVTCEMAIALDPVEATAVPRSALVFSDAGALGVRVANSSNKAAFVPVEIVDDSGQVVWVTGVDSPTRVIVVGQDFVKEGDAVDAVTAADAAKATAEPPA